MEGPSTPSSGCGPVARAKLRLSKRNVECRGFHWKCLEVCLATPDDDQMSVLADLLEAIHKIREDHPEVDYQEETLMLRDQLEQLSK